MTDDELISHWTRIVKSAEHGAQVIHIRADELERILELAWMYTDLQD
jgi:hypothetical protein